MFILSVVIVYFLSNVISALQSEDMSFVVQAKDLDLQKFKELILRGEISCIQLRVNGTLRRACKRQHLNGSTPAGRNKLALFDVANDTTTSTMGPGVEQTWEMECAKFSYCRSQVTEKAVMV